MSLISRSPALSVFQAPGSGLCRVDLSVLFAGCSTIEIDVQAQIGPVINVQPSVIIVTPTVGGGNGGNGGNVS